MAIPLRITGHRLLVIRISCNSFATTVGPLWIRLSICRIHCLVRGCIHSADKVNELWHAWVSVQREGLIAWSLSSDIKAFLSYQVQNWANLPNSDAMPVEHGMSRSTVTSRRRCCLSGRMENRCVIQLEAKQVNVKLSHSVKLQERTEVRRDPQKTGRRRVVNV
jgi:hypothetical protein